MALLVASVVPGWAQDNYKVVFQEKTGLEQVGTPLLLDLYHSPIPEIVLSDKRGRIEIRDSETGRLHRSRQISEEAITAPTAGDFRGEGRLDLAVVTRDRRLVFLDGATLEPIAESTIQTEGSSTFNVQPLTIPLKREGLGTRDAVVIIDERGTVRCCHLNDALAVQTLWTAPCQASQYPASYGKVRSKDSADVVVAARKDIALIDAATGKTVSTHVGKELRSMPALVDLDGDSLAEVVIADESNMNARKYNPERNNLSPFWPDAPDGIALTGTVQADPVVAQMPGQDPSRILIEGAGSNLVAVNPQNPRQSSWPEAAVMPGQVFTSLSMAAPMSGPPFIVFADNRKPGNIWILTATDGKSLFDPAQGRVKAFDFNRPFLGATFVVGSASPDGTISVWGASSEDRSHLVRFDIALPSVKTVANQVLWATRGGDLWHSGIAGDPDYTAWHEARAARLKASLDRHLAGFEKARGDGDKTKALEEAAWLRNFDPLSDDYQSRHRNAWIMKNLFYLILGIALAILVIGFTGLKLTQLFGRRFRVKKAETAATAGRLDEARQHYEKVLKRYPRDPRINTALASVYVAQGATGQETLAVYQRARDSKPGDTDLLGAYARALAAVPETTDEALEVYQNALSSSKEPALMEYAIGCCYKARQEWNEAAKHFRAAARSGMDTEEVNAALCDAYLAMDFRQAKAVGVYKQQFPRRQGDQKFLEAYLDACADAKLVDKETEALCQRILEGNPDYVGAYCQLAKIRLQNRNQKGASEAIDKALRIEPTHTEALFLRSQINMIEGKTDDAAVDVFVKTLEHFPDDRDILRTVSNIFAARQRFDETAIDIYRRALRENPNDIPTLRALAAAGRIAHDPALVIDVVERLGTLGQMNPELTVQLAQAYDEVECTDPKVERVLREALRQEPENPGYTRLLALVLLKQDKTDPDAMAVYEHAAKDSPDDIAIGRQLVKAYNRNSRYNEALKLAQVLLQSAPNDEELQRLVALSSLYGNKIDDAISEYKQLLARNPNDREAIVNLALAYAQKGMTDDVAGRYYQQALDITPDNENLHLIMAKVHATRGDLVRCVECYQKALKAKPQVEEKVLRHCEALLNEFTQALRVRWFFCEVLVAYNRLREALDQLGIIFETTPAQAKNVLIAIDKILNKDSKNTMALLKRGEILMSLGRAADARASLERSFTLQPNSHETQNALIRCYDACLAQQDDAEVRFRLGKLHFLTQDYDKAIGCFQRTSQDYRWEAESAKMLGKCFVGKGMLDLSLQEFKKLVVDDETKELLYDLAQRYEAKRDLVGAKTVYRQLFAADINYKDVRQRFEMLSGSTSDPVSFEKTSIVQEMSEEAKRRYELLDELGRGAMGIVYRARDKELEEVVALKILPDNLSNNPEAVRRFKVEARNARRLSHPNIVRIHDIGEEMGRKYISMEIVEGTDLKKRVKSKGKLTLKETVQFGIQIADALAYAHRLGIVHRDIKPANIMLTKKNEVKVTDFGIAKLVDSTGEGTMIGAVIGTPLYMSPEQVQGLPVDNGADIYSYGIMLYEFVHGRPPFTEGDLAYQHMHKDPAPPQNCPAEVWAVIQKCLMKKREERWSNADEIVEALKVIDKTLA